MNTLQSQYESYSTFVMPKTASETQRIETKRAFYAGAMACFQLQQGIAAGNISDDAAVQMLEGMHDELRRFATEISAGRA